MAQPSTSFKIPPKNQKNENSNLLDKEEELLRELDLDDGQIRELKEKIKVLEKKLKEKENKMEKEKDGEEGAEDAEMKEEDVKKLPRWKRGRRGRKRGYHRGRGRGNRGRDYYFKRGGNFIFNNYS